MKNKVVRVTCFVMILCLPAVLVFSVLYASGELIGFNGLLKIQNTSKEETLYGIAYSDNEQYVKLNIAKKAKAPLLALGSSRVLQFRSSFFKQAQDFYNAGKTGAAITTFKNYITNLGDAIPQVLVVGLDQWDFNKLYLNDATPVINHIPEYQPANWRLVAKSMFEDYKAKKIHILSLLKNPHFVGVSAKMKHDGFMKDGSYFNGSRFRITVNERMENVYERIHDGNRTFEYGETVNAQALTCLEEFLDYCAEKKIHVIVFTPPYAPPIIDMMKEKGTYNYMWDIPNAVRPIIEKYGFEFYDYTDIRELGCDDSYFIDGFHGGDVAYLRMVKDMIERGSALAEFCDIKQLEELDNNRCLNMLLQNPFKDFQIASNQ